MTTSQAPPSASLLLLRSYLMALDMLQPSSVTETVFMQPLLHLVGNRRSQSRPGASPQPRQPKSSKRLRMGTGIGSKIPDLRRLWECYRGYSLRGLSLSMSYSKTPPTAVLAKLPSV